MDFDTRRVTMIDADLPAFGEPTIQPDIPAATYIDRVAAARAAAAAAGFAALVVYGDREHAANVAYLTGYDPRFEETLLLIVQGRRPSLFIGTEGWGYAELAAGDFDRVLCQTFNLPGQPRDTHRPLPDLLAEAGLVAGMRIGVAGWKMFGVGDPGATEAWLEIPAFLANLLIAAAGPNGAVHNATGIFMNPEDGLRAINDVDQLACFEFATTFSSQAVLNVLFGVRPGMTELQAARLMNLNGLPLAAHTMLSSGKRAYAGLPSPSMAVLERGAPITMACSPQGALTARAGFLAADASDLTPDIQDYVERLVVPYFHAVVDWYEAIGIGTTGGTLYDAIHSRIGGKFFGVTLNPGHLIHLDEWMHSPITPGSTIPLRSGMAIQVDVIPATGSPYFTTNIEDGIALADADLRHSFAARYPEAWSRITRRRAFMTDILGIRLKPEVLPFSNIPAYLPPFLLSPRRVLGMVE
jgi:hypothetical protein